MISAGTCAETSCELDVPIAVGAGVDVVVTLADPSRDPTYELIASSTDDGVVLVEASAPEGDPEVADDRVYVVSLRGIASGSAEVRLADAEGAVIARGAVRVVRASGIEILVGDVAVPAADGTPEIPVLEILTLVAEGRAGSDLVYVGDAPSWSIAEMTVASFSTDTGPATEAMGEDVYLEALAPGLVTVHAALGDATAQQTIRVVSSSSGTMP